MRVLGFMTGTSLDAVDLAMLETDGEEIEGFGPAGEKKLDPACRSLVEAATADALRWRVGDPEPASFAPAAGAVADEHIAAADAFMRRHGLLPEDIDFIGLQGQTVLQTMAAKAAEVSVVQRVFQQQSKHGSDFQKSHGSSNHKHVWCELILL